MKKLIGCLAFVFLLACESAEDKAGRFFLMGNEALGEGNYKEAIRLYTESINQYPEMKEVWNNRGVAYYKDNQFVNAINDYTHAIKQIDAYFMDAWKNRADAHYGAGMYEEAMKDLKFLGEAYPDSSWVDFKAGMNLIAMKEYRMGVNAFRIAYKKDSTDVETVVNYANAYYLHGTTVGGSYFHQAVKYLDMAEAIDASEPNIYNTRSLMASFHEDYDEALVQVNKALAIEPNNPYFNNNRGFIHLMTGDLEQAERDINLAIKGDPRNGWAYRNKGIFYFMKERYDDALRNFEQAGGYDDSLPKLNYYWGATLVKLGREDEACPKLRISVDAFENEGRELYQKLCGAI